MTRRSQKITERRHRELLDTLPERVTDAVLIAIAELMAQQTISHQDYDVGSLSADRDELRGQNDLLAAENKALTMVVERRNAESAEAEKREANYFETISKMRAEIDGVKGELSWATTELVDARAHIARLTEQLRERPKAPAPAVPAVMIATSLNMTEVAAQIAMLAGKGHSDDSIHRIVNARKEPQEWLNLAGIRAIRQLIEVQA